MRWFNYLGPQLGAVIQIQRGEELVAGPVGHSGRNGIMEGRTQKPKEKTRVIANGQRGAEPLWANGPWRKGIDALVGFGIVRKAIQLCA